VRAFYARKEPMVPLYAVLIRLAIFLGIGITGVFIFEEIGAPVIAFAEIALLIEALILLGWLSNRTHEPLQTRSAVFKGLLAAVVGGVVAYVLALYLPGGAIVTALIGMAIGGAIALGIVWSEARQLFNL
jgi:peptidoglycan biosynthesis protein MviN/MurJ (putative lipid II flippase)